MDHIPTVIAVSRICRCRKTTANRSPYAGHRGRGHYGYGNHYKVPMQWPLVRYGGFEAETTITTAAPHSPHRNRLDTKQKESFHKETLLTLFRR